MTVSMYDYLWLHVLYLALTEALEG